MNVCAHAESTPSAWISTFTATFFICLCAFICGQFSNHLNGMNAHNAKRKHQFHKKKNTKIWPKMTNSLKTIQSTLKINCFRFPLKRLNHSIYIVIRFNTHPHNFIHDLGQTNQKGVIEWLDRISKGIVHQMLK